MNIFQSIIKADYLQRTRSNIFLITLMVSIYVAYIFLPEASATYSTVRIGNYIGFSNSAWIGHVSAIMASTFIWFIGFYIINNGIRRDVESGVGQIIATTSISNFKYLLAKTMSNFMILLTITAVIILTALGVLIARGSEYHFNLLQFLLPYLLATIPSIFFLSVLAVFFEIVFGKRTNLLNVSFFFLFSTVILHIDKFSSPQMQWTDVLGVEYLLHQMSGIVNGGLSKVHQGICLGFNIGGRKVTQYFLFEGSDFSLNYLASRFFWIVMAFVLLWISSKMFHRFDTKTFRLLPWKSQNISEDNPAVLNEETILASLPKANIAFNIYPLVKAEFMMMLRKGPRWFWLINLGLFIAMFFTPLPKALQVLLPIIWFLQINRWADIATKEKFYGTSSFIYGSFKPLTRLLTAQIMAGTLLAIVFALPVILRYMLAGELSHLTGIILGALVLVAFAVGIGILSGGKRLFEILFFTVTYGVIQYIPQLDYFGGQHNNIKYFIIQILMTMVLLATAFLIRSHEIKNQ
jgi:hypothetical protein